jgi:hypothetical protein
MKPTCCPSESCFSAIVFPSFQDFYTIVLDELVLEVAARHRDDVLAQPSDQDYHRGRRHTKIILFWIIYPSLQGMKPTYCPSESGHFPLIRHTQQVGTTRDKLLMAPQIKHNWESILPAPQYRFQTSLSE